MGARERYRQGGRQVRGDSWFFLATGDTFGQALERDVGAVVLAKDKIDALFDEFRQADATITSEFGGTGLGLSITRKFVELHKGRVWVESELGRGSTFFIAIPLRLDGGATA